MAYENFGAGAGWAPIERRDGVTLYGKMIGGRLRQFTVYSDHHGISGPYAFLGEAQKRFTALARTTASVSAIRESQN